MFGLKNWRFGVSRLHSAGGEALVQHCFNGSAIPTFFVSPDDDLIYANPAFGDLLGYDPAQCTGLKLTAIVHLDDIGAARAQAAGALHGGPVRQAETRYVRQDGEIIWVQASVSKFRSRLGRTPYCIVQAVDIDRLKRIEAELASLESRWNFVLESGGHGFWDRDLKNDRHFYSPVWRRMRGIDLTDPVHDAFYNWFSRVHPDDQDRIFAEVHEPGYGQDTASTNEFRELHKDGRWIRILTRAKVIEWGPNGEKQRFIGTDTDVTDLKNAEEKLQFANTLLRTQMDASPDGILVVDPQDRIISYNRRFADIWRITEDLLRAEEDSPVLMAVASAMKNPEAFVARVKHIYAHQDAEAQDELETKDGRSIDRHTQALRTPAGLYLGRVWFFRDVTERKKTEAQILHLARYDGLTGLANRTVFMEAVERAIAGVKRGGMTFAVLYLDLNHFKDVNDTLGHAIGDELLKAVAGRLRAATRECDVVARFGGDEFAVVVSDVGMPDDAAAIATALLRAMQVPFLLQGYDIRSSVSIGIAVFGPDNPSAETMLARADVALYRTKSEGKEGYRFHTDAMDHEIRTRVMLSSELRKGIEQSQLFLVYQPQIEIATRRIIGVEALVRWRHPVRGVLGPNIFLPIAEKTGLIGALGHWVLREACHQTKEWLDAGIAPDVVGVNLSGIQFKRAFELEMEIEAILSETGMPANKLELELTETVLMAASTDHNDVLNRLRQAGIKLAIDDFGVGYSSLDYLRRFPVDRIKIAGDFVAQITTEAGSAAIVKATLGLARELGIRVIAEGVETAFQLQLLQDWGCREAQGYYFAKPLAVEDLMPLLKRGEIRAEQAALP
jgi:diguanylate cyclase (GGDEF)-like protein/PAS domain S-box-containing protein